MKKLSVALIACLSVVAGAFAAEQQAEAETDTFQRVETRTVTPVTFAYGADGEETIDVIGVRLSSWGDCHDITGLDLVAGGSAQNAYGLQLALVRNEVRDVAGALQMAFCSNDVGGELAGVQVSLLHNNALMMRGLQLGMLNTAKDVRGFQIGLINCADMTYGYQIGLINVIKGSKVPFFPIINFQFAEE